ncbi:hypothetical protein SARC_13115 [Sphaeroforma arctica JP610]|uniref:Uncharacterized protein n=1 Tax=Sphaeroforma arctica JP610 TaxID=667725 RepID=A0A0L0FE41_9EUKA|nr:hypothetical protein SARC_13115 [Sphaeroforma arctica JP610]KNC74333.1 hypothetical protein SARC_13115 [Sphaeroforma arctica JP610]|eukprot:XP_014148235.1 hypothetical protein SARC_13115 [Sphaeroforma arctica JP610]
MEAVPAATFYEVVSITVPVTVGREGVLEIHAELFAGSIYTGWAMFGEFGMGCSICDSGLDVGARGNSGTMGPILAIRENAQDGLPSASVPCRRSLCSMLLMIYGWFWIRVKNLFHHVAFGQSGTSMAVVAPVVITVSRSA